MNLFRFFKKEKACRFLADPEGRAGRKYAAFKTLLENNNETLDIMAGLEQLYYGGGMFTLSGVAQAWAGLHRGTADLIAALGDLAPGRHAGLEAVLENVNARIQAVLEQGAAPVDGPLVLALGEAPAGRLDLLGGKAGHLAVVRNELGLPSPDGFVVTAAGFQAFMARDGLGERVRAGLDGLSPHDLADLDRRCRDIRQAVMGTGLPPGLAQALDSALDGLGARLGRVPLVAMRSSAVGEDGRATFAGQYQTLLGVGPDRVQEAYKTVVASKYTPAAILYRLRYGLDEADTPMAVLGLSMVSSAASGVLYTLDPERPQSGAMRVDALWGLGEMLVAGQGQADTYALSRDPLAVAGRVVARKRERLSLLPGGGTAVQALDPGQEAAPCLTDAQLLELGRMALALEDRFRSPQDVEWAVDGSGALLILQSRPLEVLAAVAQTPQAPEGPNEPAGPAPLFSGGRTAAPGAAWGPVLRLHGVLPAEVPEGAILVAAHAAPELASLLDRAGGLVTELGGVASHLASVARELGLPALFDAGEAARVLGDGDLVTLDATGRAVYPGRAEAVLGRAVARRGHVAGSPLHQRLRAVLDQVAPLGLTNPESPAFTPRGCRTVHDIIRYAHEMSMREVFGLSETAEDSGMLVARMKTRIPLVLYCVDLGGGLRENLTTCDQVTPEDLRSIPMRALWKGFTHPGVTWSGSVNVSASNFLTLMASSATAEAGAATPGGDSYALLAPQYVNLSAKYGYHFSNIDAFCGDCPGQNHATLRFSGGAGSFTGRTLRLEFLAAVLGRLGFIVNLTGDVLDATVKGLDQASLEAVLDRVGRLMACSRLLDLAIGSRDQARDMAEAFFRGDYNFLDGRKESPLPGFHLLVGDWEGGEEDGLPLARQDGSRWATGLSRGLAGFMGRLSGKRYQRFLDNVEAYFHFPLAVAKEPEMGDGRAELKARVRGGVIDQAAGLAFGVRNVGNYLVLRFNALEDNVILFEFRDGRRAELASVRTEAASGAWHGLAVEVRGQDITGFFNGRPVLLYHFDRPIQGLVGLWTKADSLAEFRGLSVAVGPGDATAVL